MKPDEELLVKLVGMLASDNAGEVFNAAQILKRRAAGKGKSLPELLGANPETGMDMWARHERRRRREQAHERQLELVRKRARQSERVAYYLSQFVSPRCREIAQHQVEQTMHLSDDEFQKYAGRPSWNRPKARETA